jgi:glutathione-regulated potassium-efflux system ancillary protein KefG
MPEPAPSPSCLRTLLVFAHPAIERARANWAMALAARQVEGVTFHDLYEVYPDFAIDVPEEQQRLLDHDVVVLQFPLSWFSGPALLKEWLDLVWLHGFAYGDGFKLEGKTLVCAVSAGDSAQAYKSSGPNRFTLEEFLRPLQQTAELCRMRWEPPFSLHCSGYLDAPALTREGERYKAHLRDVAARAPRSKVSAA